MELDKIITILFQLTAIVIAVLVFLDRRAARRAETFRVTKELINRDNALFLNNPSLLEIVDNLIDPSYEEQKESARKRRWVIFVMLNQMEIHFRYLKENRIHDKYANKVLIDLLGSLLKNEEVLKLVKSRGYDPEFVEYCEGLSPRMPKHKNT